MKTEYSRSTSIRGLDRLLVTEHSVHIALASFMLDRAGTRVGIDEFLASFSLPLPRIDARVKLWKTFMHLAEISPRELHDDLAIDISPDHAQRLHAVLRFGSQRTYVPIDRRALETFLVSYLNASGFDCYEAEFGPDDGDPTHLHGEIQFSDYRLDRYVRTPLCRMVNAFVHWLAGQTDELPFDRSLVRTFAAEYARVPEGNIADADVDALWHECKTRLSVFGNDLATTPRTPAAASLVEELNRFSWRLYECATPDEVRSILTGSS